MILTKYILLIFIYLITDNILFAQARLIINNDGYVVLENSVHLILGNSAPNALTTLGTGGNIVSENETDVIQWEIGTNTGLYTVPWTTFSGTKIPLSINKISAGTGVNAEFILSTYETNSDLNTPYPSAVTNMNFNGVDHSLFVIDRFWHINTQSYSAKPTVILSFGYDDAANEMIGANTITEVNLQAQRFNTNLNHWESASLYGTCNSTVNTVTGVSVTSIDFFEDWILVDNTNPLPVTLLNFEARCESEKVTINWSTQSEVNNEYFILEKSFDAKVFFELKKIQGAGNSSVTQFYTTIDNDFYGTPCYYRLKQVDFNKEVTYHKIIHSNCISNHFEVNQLKLSNNALELNILNSIKEKFNILLYDIRGREITKERINVKEGNNNIQIDNLQINNGVYILLIKGDKNFYSTKMLTQ